MTFDIQLVFDFVQTVCEVVSALATVVACVMQIRKR